MADIEERKQANKDDEHKVQRQTSQLSVENQRLQEERLTKDQQISDVQKQVAKLDKEMEKQKERMAKLQDEIDNYQI